MYGEFNDCMLFFWASFNNKKLTAHVLRMRGELATHARAQKANHIQGGKSEMSVMRKRVPPQVRNTVARYIA